MISVHWLFSCYFRAHWSVCSLLRGKSGSPALLEARASCGELGVSLEGRHPCSLFVPWSPVADSILGISPGTGSGAQCSTQQSCEAKHLGCEGQDPVWTPVPDHPCPIQEVLEEWLNCQRSWLYLEPIFSSEDINQQLPVESKRYQTMERIWRKIMRNAYESREASSPRDAWLGLLRALTTLCTAS